jgi:hypothetical protein
VYVTSEDDRRRWQGELDALFPDGVFLRFVGGDDEPESAEASMICPRLMVSGFDEEGRPFVLARPTPSSAPAASGFVIESIEPYPIGNPALISRLIRTPDPERRIWAITPHAPGALAEVQQMLMGPTRFFWEDQWYVDGLEDWRVEKP